MCSWRARGCESGGRERGERREKNTLKYYIPSYSIIMQTHAVSTTEVSSPSDILGGDGVSEDVPDTGVAEVGGRELVIIYALTHYYTRHFLYTCTK